VTNQYTKVYVSSKATPSNKLLWKTIRRAGWPIISTWIDEDDKKIDYMALWGRITKEVQNADAMLLYLTPEDFPSRGPLVEVGMALAMEIPVIACLPLVYMDPKTYRPVGSWIHHELVTWTHTFSAGLRRTFGNELADKAIAAFRATRGTLSEET